jgi:CRP/FNR family transcriptional regulator, cyclic AMP receptor protein
MSTANHARLVERKMRKAQAASGLDLLEALSKLEFSHLFDYLSLKQVATKFTLKRFPRRSVIQRAGEERQHIYGLAQGHIKVLCDDGEGDLALLDILAPGTLYGDDLLYTSSPRERTLVAYDNVTLALITKDDFQKLLGEYPQLKDYVFRSMGERLRRAEERIITLSFDNAAVRLAKVLSELGLRYGTVQENGAVRINLKLPHRELANLVGSTRESVNGHLRDLRRRKLVDISERAIIIHDLIRLTAKG